MTNNIGATLVTTEDSVKNKYYVRQYSSDKIAHFLQNTIGTLSMEDRIKYIKGNIIPNCNIKREDSIGAEKIFSPNLRSLKGKNDKAIY